jgi:hypothetical protein
VNKTPTPTFSDADDHLIVVKAGDALPLSPQHRIIQATGQDLIRQSLATGQEFCKSMISTCTGAIPLYIALFTFAVPTRKTSGGYVLIATLPPLFYLAAMIMFAAGYQPISGHLSLDVLEEIERFRDRTIRRRSNLIKAGFSLFCLATLLASLVIIIARLGTT